MDNPISARTSPSIEFWFEFGSSYSYLSAMRIEADAARHGITINWKPFLLGPVYRSLGWESAPISSQKEKSEYVLRDMARLCKKQGISWSRPTVFPRAAVLPLRVALVGAEESWINEYCQRMMSLNFALDCDIGERDIVTQVLEYLKLPASQILQRAISEENKQKLRYQTEEAKAKGIFGAPTFFVGDEMFWGNDRLDDAFSFCQEMSAT